MRRGLVATILTTVTAIGVTACATPTAGTARPAPAASAGAPTATSPAAPPPAAYLPAGVEPAMTAATSPAVAPAPAVDPAPPLDPAPPQPPSASGDPAPPAAPPAPVDPPAPATDPEPAVEPAPAPAPEPTPWTDASDENIHHEAAAAVSVTQRFWAESFAGLTYTDGSSEQWSPPELWNGDGFYDSAAGTVADCGDGRNYTGNAFFCGNATKGTGFLAWDLQFFHQHLDLGRTMVYMVIAHETGHAVQARLVHDGVPGALFDGSKRYELQADCLGGATLGRAVRDGYLTLPPTASDEMTRVAIAFGGDPAGHGNPDQRNDAFQRGFAGADMQACLSDPDS